MTYVLIIMVWLSQTIAVSQHDYSSQDACLVAKAEVVKAWGNSRVLCVPK